MTAFQNIAIWILTGFKYSAQNRISSLFRQPIPAQADVKNPWKVARLTALQMWSFLVGGLLYGLGLAFGFAALMVMSLNQGFRLNVTEVGTLQFLVAGIIPALLIFIGWIVFRTISELPRWTRTKLGRATRAWLAFVLDLAIIIGLLVVSVSWLLSTFVVDGTIETVLTISVSVVVSAMALKVFVTDRDVMARIFYRVYVGGGIIILVVLGVILYSLIVLPRLPQEFGGSRAKCVRADLQTSGLTYDTLQALGHDLPQEDGSSSVVGVDLQQMFSSDDNLFVLTPSDGSLPEQQIVKLSKSLVHSSRASQSCVTRL